MPNNQEMNGRNRILSCSQRESTSPMRDFRRPMRTKLLQDPSILVGLDFVSGLGLVGGWIGGVCEYNSQSPIQRQVQSRRFRRTFNHQVQKTRRSSDPHRNPPTSACKSLQPALRRDIPGRTPSSCSVHLHRRCPHQKT